MVAGGHDGPGRARGQNDGRRQARRARWVTGVAVAVLLGVAAAEVELWPLTSYRLFSGVRTESRSSLELVAVGPDGSRTPVPLDEHDQVLGTTSHQFRHLRDLPPAQRRAMAGAWLQLAGIDVADVARVEVERVRRTMDARTLEARVTDRRPVLEVVLREAQTPAAVDAGAMP